MLFAFLFSWDTFRAALCSHPPSSARATWVSLCFKICSGWWLPGCCRRTQARSKRKHKACHQWFLSSYKTAALPRAVPSRHVACSDFCALPSCGQMFGCQKASTDIGSHYSEASWSTGNVSHTTDDRNQSSWEVTISWELAVPDQ